ncbi:TonB-dependent receptor [Sphingomicrobium astaxanthinifaciens]|uniref:TonB-dependent receptor n=1 Tax=Sphingomicrobium astaxanthinifaciens TaxID=1227949 RepID=UPI001FCAB683|nr:TonB-dependent receptor [Sphingomicrobium astaxanthinifaciens]MCJ7420754.1 TonB-dependent receptor [Sphingomicrobium astaxanthinifaciens]
MLGLTLSSTAIALVQAAAPLAQPVPSDQDDAEEDRIVITGHVIEGLDLLAGASVVEGEELTRNLEPQVGDMLAQLPGVSATSFSPGASRPVLRGFSGERVRVLNDGLGSIDVSNTSADHAVTIDPLTAERIEVLRGPAVLIFGGQAIGGAVNVIDRRIPRTDTGEPYHFDGFFQLRSADDGSALGASLDVELTDGLYAHLDGSWNRGEDLEVGGFVLSDALRAEALEESATERAEGNIEEAEELAELANLRDVLPNSGFEQWSAAAGLGYVGDRFELGASVSLFDTDYGVPTRPGAHHPHEGEEGDEHGDEEGAEEEGEELVSIGMRQERFDARARVYLDGFFESATLRLAAADYTHTEFEGEEVGTVFDSNGVEGRLELKQRDRDGLHGAFGVQYYHRHFDAVGEEAFLRDNRSSSIGLFAVEEYQPGALGVEGALRLDFTDHESGFFDIRRDYTAVSGALGANYEVAPDGTVGANLSYTERAPSPEELFSVGPHIATQAYEVSNRDLEVESSVGGELFARYEGRGVAVRAALWANWFDDYIYLADTGLEEEESELPLFEYRQQGADFWGVEFEASAPLWQDGRWSLEGDVVADYVRATLADGAPVPRIPPLRIGSGLTLSRDALSLRGEVEHVTTQDRIASFETPTDGFTLVNASLSWKPLGERSEMVFILQANNLFDVTARRHASFTKDFVPLAGRDLRVSARLNF